MTKESSVLVYGTNLGGYRAAYGLCKKGHQVILLNRGSYVDEIRNQTLSQLPLDFCWMCGHFVQRKFKALGCVQDFYNSRLGEVSGEAGNFKVKFKTKPQTVNNFICTECDKCVEVCPVKVNGRKAIYIHPEIGWENIYLIDRENCTQCKKCEEVCPTGALKLDREEEEKEVNVGAIVLALEYNEPTDEELKDFGLGESPCVVKNSEIARNSLLTNFIQDSVQLPSRKIPENFSIIVTSHFNKSIKEYENYNLCVSAAYRGVKLKEILPQSNVTIFLKDYRGFGKKHFRWYQKALDAGVQVEKVDTLQVNPQKKEEVTIQYTKEGKNRNQSSELAILINGQKPPQTMDHLSKVCGVQSDEYGFCSTKPFSCCETNVDGIFGVGEFTGPKGNPETIWEGCGALTEITPYLGESNFKPSPPPSFRDIKGEGTKVGVFICNCFHTFEEKMDLNALKEAVNELPEVPHVEIIKGCCTPPTIKETAERIKQSGVNRVVLAVCTPIQKLLKFRKAVMMAGLNPLLSEFLRFREDVINVHKNKEEMLKKSLTLIKAGVAKVKKGSPEPTLKDKFTPQALVIGSGISGLTSSLEIAKRGFPVTLVEKGEAIQTKNKYFDDKQNQHLQELASEVENHSNITVYTNTTLKEMDGYAGNFSGTLLSGDKEIPVQAGVIVLATGAKEYKPEGFLYGEDRGVMTQTELQSGTEEKKAGNRVAMIQCVGSRNDRHPYCSRVCCNQALKNALNLKKQDKEVTIFYQDMTSYGKEDLYKEAQDAGVKFIRVKEKSYPEVKKKGNNLTVIAPGGEKKQFDTVVLSTGIVPDIQNNQNLSRILGHPLDKDGFFDSDVNVYPYEESIKRLFKPYEWATNCIYPVGLAHSPRSFEEALLTAKDVAGRAVILLGKKALPAPNAMYIAEVKESLCMGCGICVDVCPYSARTIDEQKKTAVVHPFLCDSCGTCVSACPNDASYLRDLKGDQTLASLDRLLIG
ncbi:CoB--CoM heterodisulfide reductase iron-sulfur subunit A family protein [bacterium]|nr:CoB--CoM heterodisulfide reductase iron-sulfur subunit A family protein [bacterium]